MAQELVVSRIGTVHDSLGTDLNDAVGNRLNELVVMGREQNTATEPYQTVVQRRD